MEILHYGFRTILVLNSDFPRQHLALDALIMLLLFSVERNFIYIECLFYNLTDKRRPDVLVSFY